MNDDLDMGLAELTHTVHTVLSHRPLAADQPCWLIKRDHDGDEVDRRRYDTPAQARAVATRLEGHPDYAELHLWQDGWRHETRRINL